MDFPRKCPQHVTVAIGLAEGRNSGLNSGFLLWIAGTLVKYASRHGCPLWFMLTGMTRGEPHTQHSDTGCRHSELVPQPCFK